MTQHLEAVNRNSCCHLQAVLLSVLPVRGTYLDSSYDTFFSSSIRKLYHGIQAGASEPMNDPSGYRYVDCGVLTLPYLILGMKIKDNALHQLSCNGMYIRQ